MKMAFEVTFKEARTILVVVDYHKERANVQICEKLLNQNENVLKVHFLGWYNGASSLVSARHLHLHLLETLTGVGDD
jgi:predicted nucleic acid-binding OB-fold protein